MRPSYCAWGNMLNKGLSNLGNKGLLDGSWNECVTNCEQNKPIIFN